MVPLSDLLAAQSEAKWNKEEAQTKLKDLARLQEQLTQAHAQADAESIQAAKLQAEMGCMVPRSDLEDAKAQVKILEEEQRLDNQQYTIAVSHMQERVTALEHERCETLSAMQVCACI